MRLQITSGRGPVEVRQCVADLAAALEGALPEVGWTVLGACFGPGDPPASVVLHLEKGGPQAQSLSRLVGTHAFVLARRGRGQRKRWFVGVGLVEDGTGEAVELRPADVRVRADRAGGPGGQHVNTTATAIRATHIPTGLSVRVARHRSQSRNRSAAMDLLAQLLADRRDAWEHRVQRRNWTNHHTLQRGRPVVEWRSSPVPAEVVDRCFTLP